MKNPFLVGEKVYLRPLSLEDLDGNYVSWLNDSEVCVNNSHHIFPYTKEMARDYIQNAYISKDKLILAAVLKENHLHIGNISLLQIDFISQNAAFAVLFGEKEYWGKGLSKEAALLIIRHGFDALNLHRIYCGTFSENIPMIKLANYLGMEKEGVRREAFLKNGKLVNIIEFGLLKHEFYTKFDFLNTNREDRS